MALSNAELLWLLIFRKDRIGYLASPSRTARNTQGLSTVHLNLALRQRMTCILEFAEGRYYGLSIYAEEGLQRCGTLIWCNIGISQAGSLFIAECDQQDTTWAVATDNVFIL